MLFLFSFFFFVVVRPPTLYLLLLLQSKSAGVIFSSVTAHTFKGLAFDTNTTSLMAKIQIYGYRPEKLPANYKEIFFMDSTETTSASMGLLDPVEPSNIICNMTNLFFTSNKSNKLRLTATCLSICGGQWLMGLLLLLLSNTNWTMLSMTRWRCDAMEIEK